MSQPIISVEGLSKAYRIGLKDEVPDTLASAMVGAVKAPLRKYRKLRRLNTYGQGAGANGAEAADIVWALRDVSFEVQEGEVLGVIGRNGAGKSTLLKILSRITEPTGGRAVLRGRVSSLLEVGTGFHPELTGRDNVYMNGTILGMRKREIDAKFDEIVDFSGVEKFLDTPIKRYSSGMTVRLAFAVAAHLEPEILIVDEVLAVGDAEFQKKCMGKMQDVARGGRTVLFVSHNMSAVGSLCRSGVIVKGGRSSNVMPIDEAITGFLNDFNEDLSGDCLEQRTRYQEVARTPVFSRLRIIGRDDESGIIPSCSPVRFEMELRGIRDLHDPECAIVITNQLGQRVLLLHTKYHSGLKFGGSESVHLSCDMESLPLVPSTYFVDLVIASGRVIVERLERAGQIEVTFHDVFGTGNLPNSGQGNLVVPASWSAQT